MPESEASAVADDPFAVRSRIVDEVVFRALTVNGSVYELNLSHSVWRRVVKTAESGELRAEGGETLIIGRLEIGRSLSLVYLPFDGDSSRLLITSPVSSLSVLLGRKNTVSN